MNCEQIDELLAAFSVDALVSEEDAAVRAHLVTCRKHDEALAALQAVVERLPLAAEEREPRAELRSRLLDAFDAEVAATRVRSISSARRPSFARRASFAYLAAAAVLVLAIVGLAVWNIVLQTGGSREGTMVVHLVGDTGSGELVYVRDRQVAVMKLELPELESGRAYQAWRIDNGQPASLGLVPNAGMVAMDVDLSGAGSVAISEEPAGGSDQPTTRPLVAGELPNLRGTAGFLAASLPSPHRTAQHHQREEVLMTPRKDFDRMTRRELLGLMAGAGAAAVVGCGDNGTSDQPAATDTALAANATAPAGATPTSGPSTVSCVVSPTMMEGPYFVDEMLNRSDIRSDPSDSSVKDGVPLRLAMSMQSVNGAACTPLSGAHVDIWHCDAGGRYSDEAANNTAGQKFLRGYQLTDENGAVQFTTIYPGWYMGRAVHIHLKVRTDPGSQQGYEFTSQLFFSESITDQVHAQAPYSSHGTRDTLNSNDSIYSGGGSQMMLKLIEEGPGYAGAINIGVQMS